MKVNSLGAALRAAYEACESSCMQGVSLDRMALRQSMVAYVQQKHNALILAETAAMLEREAEAYIKARHNRTRPSAAAIQRAISVVTGVQAPLPTFESVLGEKYDLPDGRTVSLGHMTIGELRLVVAVRRKQFDEDRAILGRLELMLGEAERRNVKTVRELLAAS